MAQAQKPAPAIPASKPVGKAAEEFGALKQQISNPSWSMVPNNWDRIQLAYVGQGSEAQAKAFLKAIQLNRGGII
ncbi:MAG: hypothetical protein N3F07_03565 [Candidatus Micrarchaeota archaeon]|nr:hypothetical protein [Candidatus Micrarchaeota archaeon]